MREKRGLRSLTHGKSVGTAGFLAHDLVPIPVTSSTTTPEQSYSAR